MSEPRTRLMERLATLRDLQQKVERRRRGEFSRDPDDQSQELEDVDVLDAMEARSLEEIRHILAALDNLDRGRWGVCTVCGENIPPGRLEIMPWTDKCVEHSS